MVKMATINADSVFFYISRLEMIESVPSNLFVFDGTSQAEFISMRLHLR